MFPAIKGILQPKLKIMSSFTHPQVVMSFFLLLNTKRRYFEERLEANSCLAPLTSIVEKIKYYGNQWCQAYNRSSKYLPLCSAEERNSYRFATTCG